MSFPDAIKKIRTDAGLSQDAFAKLLGISRATINRWEQGTQEPSALAIHTLEEYCRKRGIPINSIIQKSGITDIGNDTLSFIE